MKITIEHELSEHEAAELFSLLVEIKELLSAAAETPAETEDLPTD